MPVSPGLISQLASQPSAGAAFAESFKGARSNRLLSGALRGDPGAAEKLAEVNPQAFMQLQKQQQEMQLKEAQRMKAEAEQKKAQAELLQTDQDTFTGFYESTAKRLKGIDTIEDARAILGPLETDFYRAYKEMKGIDLEPVFGPPGEMTEQEWASYKGGEDPDTPTGDFTTWQIIGTDEYKTVNEATPEGQKWLDDNADRIRKAPQQTEAGGVGEFEGRSKKEMADLRGAEVATRNAIRNTYRLQDLIKDDPDALTATGRGVSIARAMANEAEAVARTFGVEIPEGLNDAARYASTFETLGVDNARARGMLTNLAYTAAAANGQSGRSVSDRDVKRFLERIGGGYMDPQARVAVLDDFVEEIAEGYKVRHSVVANEPYQGDLGLRGAGAAAQTATQINTREEWQALAPGTRYTDPNGKERIKK